MWTHPRRRRRVGSIVIQKRFVHEFTPFAPFVCVGNGWREVRVKDTQLHIRVEESEPKLSTMRQCFDCLDQ